MLSAYALYVEKRIHASKGYRPLCDFRSNISCSKAFSSPYGSLVFMSNAAWGLLYYAVVFAVEGLRPNGVKYIAGLALLGTAYLAYLSYVRQRNFCLVCSAVYLVNVSIFVLSLR